MLSPTVACHRNTDSDSARCLLAQTSSIVGLGPSYSFVHVIVGAIRLQPCNNAPQWVRPLQVAFPNCQDVPTCRFKIAPASYVPHLITLDLQFPVFKPRSRDRSMLALVTVPKITTDEYYAFLGQEHQVRLPRQVLSVQPEPKSATVQTLRTYSSGFVSLGWIAAMFLLRGSGVRRSILLYPRIRARILASNSSLFGGLS